MMVCNDFISQLDWKKLQWKSGEVAGKGLDIRYGKKRGGTNETRGKGSRWGIRPGTWNSTTVDPARKEKRKHERKLN